MQVTGRNEKDSSYYDAIYEAGYDASHYEPVYRHILSIIGRVESPRVLEIGCGIGALAEMIAATGTPYRGFDFSETAVRRCRQRLPHVKFSVGDAYEQDSFRPVGYNVVVATEVLEHVDDRRVIENIPVGALLIATVPDFDDDSHLRLYRDVRVDIVERFAAQLKVHQVGSFTSNSLTTGAPQTYHVFYGTRVAAE